MSRLSRAVRRLTARVSTSGPAVPQTANEALPTPVAPLIDVPHCNLCGGTEFRDLNGRPHVFCVNCGTYERTRTIKLLIDHFGLLKPGMRVLHLAPEKGLANHIISVIGKDNYDARDIDPEIYKGLPVTKFDLTKDAATLPSRSYDLVLHNHVMEHLQCNVTAVLYHLHRSLRDEGTHLFSVPILRGFYEEDLSPLSEEQRHNRFRQFDHVRRFGEEDIHKTIGMIFDIPRQWDLTELFPAEVFDRHNIPLIVRRNYREHGIFMARKDQLLLRD